MPENNQPKPEQGKEQPRIGVYVCNCGGNIGDVVQCQIVAARLGKLPNVVASRTHMFMCSDPGQNTIIEDIKEKGVNRVVIGACSPFLHEQTFRKTLERAGLNPYLYYHVGLREQDSWVHHNCPQEATEKAVILMATGIAKARHLEALEPIRLEAQRHALVIGGGVAGLRAALDIARCGLKVTLIEKSPFIGGRVPRLNSVFPINEDARKLSHDLIAQVSSNQNIRIYTQTEVIKVKGYVGDFHVELRQTPRGFSRPLSTTEFEALDQALADYEADIPDEFDYYLTKRKPILMPYLGGYPDIPAVDWEHIKGIRHLLEPITQTLGIELANEPQNIVVNVGAVVIATGFQPYQPFPGEFGFGELPEVITLPQLERILSPDGPTDGKLEWAGHKVRSLAMIHCVGSRQIEGVHQAQADGQVNDYCSRVCCTATLQAANEIRERFPQVQVYDLYQDIRTYGRGHEKYYTKASKNRVIFLRYYGEEPPEVTRAPKGDAYPVLIKVKDRLINGEEIEVPVDLVVLAVGMMPNPVQDLMEIFKITPGKDRFLLEAHPKLRPVETAVPGVVLAGTAQGPMNIQESSASGSAAAAKVSALLGLGKVELEPFVARVNSELCQGSGECVKVCPYEGAIELNTVVIDGVRTQRAVVTPANCKGCGACVSACPNHAIDLLGWTIKQYEAMLDALVMDLPMLEVKK